MIRLLVTCGLLGARVPAQSTTSCKPLAIPNAVYVPAIAGFSSIETNGRVKVEREFPLPLEGSWAQVGCRPGFANPGASWLVCSDGAWDTAAWESPLAPECLAQCQPLNISNSLLNPPTAATGLTPHNQQVAISCKAGFEFVGDSPVTCYFGEFLNVEGSGCFLANQSFCRDPALLPVLQGLVSQYPKDPMALNTAINYYMLNFRGIRENGLEYLGLTPTTAVKDWGKLAYFVSGITGSDAVYRAVALPAAWNITALPSHFQMKSTYCRLWDAANNMTTYVFKVLYKEGFGIYEYRK